MSQVDVIVPSYNYGRYLRACVESVLAQDGVEVRVLILDDESTDETPEVAAALAAQDVRVESRRHPRNIGHIATYNEGLDWIAGDYALLLSADDVLTPGSLRRAARLLDAHPEMGLVYGRFLICQGDARPVLPEGEPGEDTGRVLTGSQFLEEVIVAGENPVATATAVVRTTMQKQIGGYRPELTHTGDFEMWLRFAAHGSVGVLKSAQAFWRVHAQNMRHEYRGLRDLRQHKAAFDVLFGEYGQRLADADRWRRIAYRHLAEAVFWMGSTFYDEGDTVRCQQCLELAREWCPALESSRDWSRLRWKRMLGPRLWRRLMPLVRAMRGRPVSRA